MLWNSLLGVSETDPPGYGIVFQVYRELFAFLFRTVADIVMWNWQMQNVVNSVF
jgi:hypothetical protein